MNPNLGMHGRLQQQQQREARERTHEPICVEETRLCWIEFGASLACLILGIVFVFAGVSADSSTVGSSGGSQTAKPAGILALTYIGVALLIIGAALLIVFGVHFHRVKTRLDAAKAERFAQLGIQPSSRYQQLPSQPQRASNFSGPPRPPPLPLPSREQPQKQQQNQLQQQSQSLQPQQQPQVPVNQQLRLQPPQMSSSRLQPMPSYREGAFYNLGFLGDEAEARPTQQPTVAIISTGRAPTQQQSSNLLPDRRAPMQPSADETHKPTSLKGTLAESDKQRASTQSGAPLPAGNTRRGVTGQHQPAPRPDQTRYGLSAQQNAPHQMEHSKFGRSDHYAPRTAADHAVRGLSNSSADQSRPGHSSQYGVSKREEYPVKNSYVRNDGQGTANYTKPGPPTLFEEAPGPADRSRPAGFVAPAAENFSVGFTDAPPAGAVGGVQSSRSYHSGFKGGATRQPMPASASGQDFRVNAVVSESGKQVLRPGRPHGDSPHLPSWQRPPVETPPPQRSPPPGYALDPLSLMRQPLREAAEFDRQGQQQPQAYQQRPQLQQQSAASQPRKHQGYRSSQI